MVFYHPLVLGVARPRGTAPGGPSGQRGGETTTHEAWREGVSHPGEEYERRPEEQVFARLRSAAGQERTRLWVVLGEPGAGKSRLLNEWFRRWAADLGEARLGLPVPALVRLRRLAPPELRLGEGEFADWLWEQGLGERGLLDQPRDAVYRADAARLFRPVWLLDALDEVSPSVPKGDLLRRLAALPGLKLLTCRTAVFQAQREAVAPYQEGQAEYVVLPLGPMERRGFLAARLGDPGRAAKLGGLVDGSAQLAGLAGNPLMLSLIAEVFEADADRAPLPATRAAFYRESEVRMWHRRLEDPERRERLRPWREKVLDALAGRMALRTIEATWDELDAAVAGVGAPPEVTTALQDTGLLVAEGHREAVRFFHLTLQEFHLARTLVDGGLRLALERHWRDPRYEETLGLLLSLLAAQDRTAAIEDGLGWLLDWGREAHRTDPATLRRLRRSPLRVCLHLVRRAGVEAAALGSVAERLRATLNTAPLARLAVAADGSMPSFLLAALARDKDRQVRREAAWNSATPPEALGALARDKDRQVRQGAAGNSATPPEALLVLVWDEDITVCQVAPGNSAMPPEALAALARSKGIMAREGAAGNSATPPEALLVLARDGDAGVRREAAGNSAMPPEALAALARSKDFAVREGAAGNSATPPEVLLALARDEFSMVRYKAAGNSAMPPEALAALARDGDAGVRQWVAGNRATPPEALGALARDGDAGVRRWVAGNRATPPEALAALARDRDAGVRLRAAGNSAMPPEALGALARDKDRQVRWEAAWNSATPPEALAALARDRDAGVRQGVARNSATPPEALGALARDRDAKVRQGAAGNSAMILEALIEPSSRDAAPHSPRERRGPRRGRGTTNSAGTPELGQTNGTREQ